MKKRISLPRNTILLLCIAAITGSACSSTSNKLPYAERFAKALDSSQWRFTPATVLSQTDVPRTVYSSSEYIRCSKNKFTMNVFYLPITDGQYDANAPRYPFDFTSSNFTITKRQLQKDNWSVVVKPKDVREIDSLDFNFYSNGTANLRVVMMKLPPVSFNGKVEMQQ